MKTKCSSLIVKSICSFKSCYLIILANSLPSSIDWLPLEYYT